MVDKGELFIGIDLHKQRWHVTIKTFDVEVFSASIPGTWEALQRVLARYVGHQLKAVYEAGYFGFRLHDRLVAHGIPCLVTPPIWFPRSMATGSRPTGGTAVSWRICWPKGC
jgi:transposase